MFVCFCFLLPCISKSYGEILWGTSFKVEAQCNFVCAVRAKVALQGPWRQAVRSVTLGCTFSRHSVWYAWNSRFSDPVTEACLCHYPTQAITLQIAEEKVKKSWVTCKYRKQAVELRRYKATALSNIIFWNNIWVMLSGNLKLDLHLREHLHWQNE